jgi:hypothetical protein
LVSDEFEKPRPKVRALGIHDLRPLVSARHKMVCSTVLSLEEAVTLVEEEYKVDHDSASSFVQWLRGERPGQPPENKQAIERIHVVTDPRTGDERYLDTQPGSIPPRPAPKGKR